MPYKMIGKVKVYDRMTADEEALFWREMRLRGDQGVLTTSADLRRKEESGKVPVRTKQQEGQPRQFFSRIHATPPDRNQK